MIVYVNDKTKKIKITNGLYELRGNFVQETTEDGVTYKCNAYRTKSNTITFEELYSAERIVELKEFVSFEIQKIEDINPQVSEDEDLLLIKKELSKKEKVLQSISQANKIFESEHHAIAALDALDINSSFFSDALNELRATLDSAQEKFSALDEIDVEEVLNRIEELSALKRRYGTIEDALMYKEKKKLELAKYENIEIEKKDLEQRYIFLDKELRLLAQEMTELRTKELQFFAVQHY